MRDAAYPTDGPLPRAQGRVLKAVAKTWPGFVAGALEGRAHDLIEAGRHDEAATVLQRGVERYGPESVSGLLLAWCLHAAGRSAEALPWAEAAVEDEPENADAHWLRANALFDLERSEEAVRVLQEAVELMPDDGRYHMQLAWLLHEDRPYAETRELVEQGLERAPEDAWVHHTAGRIYDHHLRHRLAHAHYVRALELDPERAEARADLAEVLQARGRLSAGVRTAREAVDDERVPGDAAREAAELYDATLRRWSWRWYEWVLRSALLLNVFDWIAPTPMPGSAVAAGVLVAAWATGWTWSLLALPPQCRRDLAGPGRGGFFAGALARTALVLAGTALMLIGELTALQHLGVTVLILGGYLEWYVGAARISGRRAFGAAEAAGQA